MAHPVYYVPAGDVLPVFFSTYAGATGASITCTGLAVTDIEIYKDGSTTQRASDAGYTLLDTDGIDFDSLTGIHAFSIDTGDNTDASFYTVGAWFTVVVSAITVDSQTVSFVACQFRIMAAEGVAGVPDVNTTHIADTSQTGRDLGASVLLSSGTGTGQVSLSSGLVRLSATGVDDVLDEVVESTYTMRQMLRLFGAALAGTASGLGTTTATYVGVDGTTSRLVATVDADGNRTAVTKTVS